MVEKNLLIIEDSSNDIEFIKEAFSIAELDVNISVAKDGDEAVKYLNQEEPYLDSPRPEVILLDLNLPKKSGHEILKYCRQNEKFRHIPVIILTTSDSQDDINKCYEQECNAYLVKPFNISKLVETVKELHELWFSVSKLLER